MANEHHERVALAIALVAIAGIGLIFLNNSPTGLVGGKTVNTTITNAPIYWGGEPIPGGSSETCPKMKDHVGPFYSSGSGIDLAAAYADSLVDCGVGMSAAVKSQLEESQSNNRKCSLSGCSFTARGPTSVACHVNACIERVLNSDGSQSDCVYQVTILPDGTPQGVLTGCQASGGNDLFPNGPWRCLSQGTYDIGPYACAPAGTSSAK